MIRVLKIFLLVIALGGSPICRGHDVATSMSEAARNFINILTEEQKALALFKLTDEERINWHFIPKPFEGEKKRGGISLKDLLPEQRHLAYALLSTGLSHKGFSTALQIMSLESILWEMEQDPKRDTSRYYFTIFGQPENESWGWRVEGHHMSMNFTIADGKVASGTPLFFGSNPAEVQHGPRKGLRVLADEEDVARSLVKSLNEEQKKAAVIMEKAPQDVLTSAHQKVDPLQGGGVNHSALNPGQQKQLETLIQVYLGRIRDEAGQEKWQKIKEAGLDKIVFAWAGGFEKNEPAYYRVQGPTFLLEYANTQNGANHVHAVWRDFNGDFGVDLLRKHYAEHHAR